MFENCNDIDQIFNCIQLQAVVLTETWLLRALQYARYLFYTLFTLELIVTGYLALQRRGQWDELLQQVATKIIIMGVILTVLLGIDQAGSLYLPATAFVQVPEAIARETAVFVAGTENIDSTPGQIFTGGFTIAGEYFNTAFSGTRTPDFTVFGMNVPMILSLLVAIIVYALTIGVFIRMTVEYLQIIIETYIAVGAGAVTLALFAFRGTAPIASGYVRYIVSLLLRLFFLMFVVLFAVKVGEGLLAAMKHIQTLPANIDTWDDYLKASLPFQLTFAASMLLVHYLLKLPDKLSQQLTANLSIDVAGMLKKL